MTQLRPASDRFSSSWILGSATIAMVLSMVASSCMPPIAMTAAMNRRDGNQAGYLPVRSSAVCSTCMGRARFAPPSASRWMAARSASLRAVIAGYLTVILRIL